MLNPTEIAISGGKLYVLNPSGDDVTQYDAASGSAGLTFGGISFPSDLAISGDNLFVSGYSLASYHQSVMQYTVTTGTTGSLLPSEGDYPTGLAVYGSEVYIADSVDFTLAAYDFVTGTTDFIVADGTDNNPAATSYNVNMAISPVPEPADYGPVVAGIGLLVAMLRSRGARLK